VHSKAKEGDTTGEFSGEGNGKKRGKKKTQKRIPKMGGREPRLREETLKLESWALEGENCRPWPI